MARDAPMRPGRLLEEATVRMMRQGSRRFPALLLALTMLLGAACAVAVPAGAAFAASAGTTCTTTASGTTCTTTDASGNVLGTCTVSGAASCTPAVSGGAGSGAVASNLQALQTELTPNVGAVMTNPVMAPLIEGGMFILSMIILWFLFNSLYQLAVKVHEQSKGGTIDHKSLHGALFAVGILLLLVAGGATWLLVAVVQGLSSFLKVG